ncbi:AraC family transcriptional regulator [Winogradskyella echinorum]|uniref:AraC family transcriptional regulator n=1 Tax=Winogradskyella echinorum TaxID=538189 RepID=A0ABR6XYM1_9FLAO|nr:helix-turn-helix domain-containing protein [Winogradskyella echinorum]MBC3845581.1 AraC family transcriptional regulator [Winogradskyella echinorum]MBC5749929.1 AraC family transcriptional regulator [Winogradskyella echinorum]
MIYTFKEFSTNAIFSIGNEGDLKSFSKAKQTEFYTFIWSNSDAIEIIIDSIPFTIKPHSILALTPIQYLEYIKGNDAIVYQFNREFYCIKDHDQEVSCAGILFFGNTNIPVIHLNDTERYKFKTLHDVFIDELETEDNIQAEMLRMLMARFIIKCTRLLKTKEGIVETPKSSKVDLLREFNFLVEQHFKTEHSVAFYAEKLFRSPKTLSNNFAKLNRSPLQIIHERIVLEAKRLLTYTNKTAKEIAFEIGFEDPSHLSRLFKKHTSLTPSNYKKGLKTNG